MSATVAEGQNDVQNKTERGPFCVHNQNNNIHNTLVFKYV